MKREEFARHLEELLACRVCPNVFGEPVTGAVAGARMMLVGQAPGPHEVEDRRPFAYTAGKRLFGWFTDALGVTEEAFRKRIHICAVIRCFPGRDPKNGGDRVPAPDEIERCGQHLDREIRILGPQLVIAVGTLAASSSLASRSSRTPSGGSIARHEPGDRSTWLCCRTHPAARRG